MKRMFVALELPISARAGILEASRETFGKLKGISLVREENMHVTLKFLGNVDDEAQSGLQTLLPITARETKPFKVGYGGIGYFGRQASISSIWLGADEPTGSLGRLAREIEGVCKQVGIPEEGKAYHPHLTLLRVKQPGLLPKWDELQRSFGGWSGEVLHTGFGLFSSTLTPAGPIYEKIDWYGFGN